MTGLVRRAPPLGMVVSPYHLTTREVPAMAALLLADHIVTMVPAPLGDFGPRDLRRAVEKSPRYLRFMESWSWSLPLWRAGVVVSAVEGDDASSDLRDVCESIDTDEAFADLRPLMKRSLFDDDHAYLDALAGDLLKGGPDPAVSVPVAAALDRFASRHRLLVARSDPTSVAQRAESALSTRQFGIAIPVLIQADGDQLLRARDILGSQLEALRSAFTAQSGAGGATLGMAAEAYARAFDARRAELTRGNDDLRVVDGVVVLNVVSMPLDAVLTSSATAARALSGRAARGAIAISAAEPAPLTTLIVKAMGARNMLFK